MLAQRRRLGVWAYQTLMGFDDDIFRITPLAIDINDTRALHAAELVRDALRNMGHDCCGRPDPGTGGHLIGKMWETPDTAARSPGRKLTEMGADIVVHDPYVRHWRELEKQDTYPAPGHSRSRFFRNQEKLKDTVVQGDLAKALRGVDSVVLAVRHEPYRDLKPDEIVRMTGKPIAVIDCFGILDDEAIRRYFELGCEVKGLGRGHINRIKDKVRSRLLHAGQATQRTASTKRHRKEDAKK